MLNRDKIIRRTSLILLIMPETVPPLSGPRNLISLPSSHSPSKYEPAPGFGLKNERSDKQTRCYIKVS